MSAGVCAATCNHSNVPTLLCAGAHIFALSNMQSWHFAYASALLIPAASCYDNCLPAQLCRHWHPVVDCMQVPILFPLSDRQL
jgi:hypothetical protein